MLFQNAYMRGVFIGALEKRDISKRDFDMPSELRVWLTGVPIRQAMKIFKIASHAYAVEFQGDQLVFEFRYKDSIHSDMKNIVSEAYIYDNRQRIFVHTGLILKKITAFRIIECLEAVKKRQESGIERLKVMEASIKNGV